MQADQSINVTTASRTERVSVCVGASCIDVFILALDSKVFSRNSWMSADLLLIIKIHYIQSIPQSLTDLLLRQYEQDDRVWAGITR